MVYYIKIASYIYAYVTRNPLKILLEELFLFKLLIHLPKFYVQYWGQPNTLKHLSALLYNNLSLILIWGIAYVKSIFSYSALQSVPYRNNQQLECICCQLLNMCWEFWQVELHTLNISPIPELKIDNMIIDTKRDKRQKPYQHISETSNICC